MKNKIPSIQKAWRRYKELWEQNQDSITWHKIFMSLNDIILFLSPYILATYFHSTFSRPKKYMGHKKNRNI